MDTCNAFIEFYYTHQKRFKCTHAKSLSNFIKPNNSVLNAHTHLFYRILLNPISPAFWITYTISSTNFTEPNTSVLKCTHTLSLLNFVELNTSVLNAHIQRVYLNLLNQAGSQGAMGAISPQLKKMRQKFSGYWNFWYINQRNTSVQINVMLKKPILIQFLVELDQNSMVY